MDENAVEPDRGARIVGVLTVCLAAVLCLHYGLTRLPFGLALAAGIARRARDLAILAALVIGAWAIGSNALRRLRVTLEPGPYRSTVAIALGLIWHMSAVIILAIAQAIRPWTLLLVLAIPLVLLWPERGTLIDTARSIAARSLRPTLLAAVFIPTAVFYTVIALSPPIWTDPLTYHLSIPLEYLRHGGVPPGSGNFFHNFPIAFSMLNVLLMGLGSDLTPKLLHFLFVPMTVVVAHHHFRRVSSEWVSSWAAVLFVCQWTVFHGVQRANVDFEFCFYGLTAFLLLAESLAGEEPRPFARVWPLVCGLLLGTTVAGKVNGVTCVVGMVVVLAVALMRKASSWRQAAALAGTAFLAYVPTLLRNVIYSFDPFVFWLTDRFGWTSYVAPLELARWHGLDAVKPVFMTRPGLVTFFGSPIFAYTDGSFPTTTFDGFLDPLYLIGLPLGILLLRRNRFVVLMYAYLAGFYCGWFFTTPLTRYAIPVMPLLAFLTVASFDRLAALGMPWLRGAFAWLIAALSIFNIVNFAVEIPFVTGYSLPAFFDVIPRRAFLENTRAIDGYVAGETIRALEAREGRTTESARRGVFMVLASESYYLQTRYYNDPFYVNLGLLEGIARSGQDPLRWLRDQGYGYVLFEQARLPWLFSRAHDNPYLNPYPQGLRILGEEIDFFRRDIEPRLQPVQRLKRTTLYRIPDAH